MSDIDVLHTQLKQQLNRLFFKNPEELRGYITGFIVYLAKSLGTLFKKAPLNLREEIAKEKEAYGHIISIKEEKTILIEYIL